MMADGDALVRLMADLQRKISQIEMQVSLMKPIALQVTEILTRNPMGSQEGVGSSRSSVGNTPRAQSSAPVKRRETSTSGPAWTGNDGRSLCTATSNTKTPKQKTDNDAWMKSFAYNYTEMDDCPIVPDVTDRDRIFKEAESREKGSSLWTRMAKKVMSPGSDGGSAPKMCLSDSRKKLSAEAPKAAAKAATAERRKSFSSKFSAIARSFESERVASADDGCPPEVIESQTLSLDEGILRRASKDRSPSALLKDKRRLDKRKSNNPSKRNSIDCEQQSTPEPVDMPVEESIPPKATDSLPSPSPPTDGVIENYVGFMNTVSQKPLKFTPPPPRLYEVGLDDVVKLSRQSSEANSLNVSTGSSTTELPIPAIQIPDTSNTESTDSILINIEDASCDGDDEETPPQPVIVAPKEETPRPVSKQVIEARKTSLQVANSTLSRRASVYTALINVTTTAKYNEKGSLASLEEQKSQVSKRSKGALEKDDKDQDEEVLVEYFWNKGLNPLSSFNVVLEFYMALIYISVLWLVPLLIAFNIPIHWSYSVILTATFVFDTAIEAITLREKHPALVSLRDPNIKDWQAYYFRNNFIIDVISAFPFECLPVPGAIYLYTVRLIRVYKLPHIMNTSPKFIGIRKSLESALGIGQTFSGIFPLMFALCAFLHIQASAIFWVGELAGFTNAAIAQVQYKSVGDQYTWALFTAVGNTFPMTYKPISTLEQLVVLVFIIAGAGLYASIVGTLSSFAMGVDASGRLYKQKMDELREYMRWKDLSDTTRRKVMKYYEIKYRGKFFEEQTLLNEMNDSLRMEIAAHNCRELIQKVGFLRREMGDGRDELFVGRIATALIACYFVPGDVIITQGEIGYEMYFILHGAVDIVVNGKRVVQFKDGAFFGELALIANIPRTATVQAATSCMLYRLTRPDFISILSEFDDMRKRIDIIYNERMAKVKLEEEDRKNALAVASPQLSPPASNFPSPTGAA